MNNIVTAVCLVTLLIASVECKDWKTVHERLVGRVIHIESLRDRGEWAHVSKNYDGVKRQYYIDWKPIISDNIYYDCRSQYLVSFVDNEYVTFKSVCEGFENRFLRAGYPTGSKRKTILLAPSDNTENDVVFHWTVKCKGGKLAPCQFLPRRFPYQRMVHQSQDGLRTHDDYWCTLNKFDGKYWKFKIHAPDPTDKMVKIFRLTNDEIVAQHFTLQVSVGISQTFSGLYAIQPNTEIEIEGAFKSWCTNVSSKIFCTWMEEATTTYKAATTKLLIVNVPARTTIALYQLRGNFADAFNVGAETYLTVEEPSVKKEMTRDGPKKTKRGKPISRLHRNATRFIDLADFKNLPEPISHKDGDDDHDEL